MDGIFGVGLAEMLIIGLALFVIGGPKNTAKWAREMGKMVRQVRQAWAGVMADLENELGPEGKELMDAARELGQGTREVTSMGRPTRLLGETMKMVESSLDVKDNLDKPAAPADKSDKSPTPTPAPAPETTPSAAAPSANGDGKKYNAWLPPDQDQPS
jgi:sec-independent protein translocase protein TatB